MRFLFATIRKAFSKTPPFPPVDELQSPLGNDITPVQRRQRDKRTIRRIVGQNSSGSVLLQRGKYVTEDELNERRERVLAHKWDDE